MRRKSHTLPYHPETPAEIPLTESGIRRAFGDSEDLTVQPLPRAGGDVTVLFLNTMVRTERVNDYLIRPIMTEGRQETPVPYLLEGGLWVSGAQLRTEGAQVAEDLLNGCAAILCADGAVTVMVPTEEKRAISPPENEVQPQGARDSFVESADTDLSLVRRHLKTPKLRVSSCTVGRKSATNVKLLWLDGLTDPALVRRAQDEVEHGDVDAVLTMEEVKSLLSGGGSAVFPQTVFTERPDRFCRGLLEGRVGVLVDGIPCGGLVPADITQFLQAPQDRSYHPLAAAALLILRYGCVLLTLLLPGFYIAVACFHSEMLPTRLLLSIIASKQHVPFGTVAEVLGLLAAFEVLQEAGMNLARTTGQTVSIIGGLVVGQAAVDAKIVSPVVVIVVAVCGVSGFTVPDQDMANALRLWRFLLAAAAGLAGLFGLFAGCAALVLRLAAEEPYGLPYLTPLLGKRDGLSLLGRSISGEMLRPPELHPKDERRRR